MQRYLLPIALIAIGTAPASFAAEMFYIEKTHADVLFSIDHAGFTEKHGCFREVDGTLQYDATKLDNSKVDVTVRTDSIDTMLAARDKELKGEKFFDSAKYPEMRFVSTRVIPGANQELRIDGNLTLHGVTKPLTLNARLNKAAPNPFDKRPTLGFTATSSLKRSDFDMTNFIPVVGDVVMIKLEIEFNRPL